MMRDILFAKSPKSAIVVAAVSPAAKARNMTWPLTPSASLATCPSLILPLSMTF
jgi:hypothetical protein